MMHGHIMYWWRGYRSRFIFVLKIIVSEFNFHRYLFFVCDRYLIQIPKFHRDQTVVLKVGTFLWEMEIATFFRCYTCGVLFYNPCRGAIIT